MNKQKSNLRVRLQNKIHTAVLNLSFTFPCLIILSSLGACVSQPKIMPPSIESHQGQSTTQPTFNQSKYLCSATHQHQGQVIGDGHCVSLIKQCSNAPHTSLWLRGSQVLSLKPGSIKEGSIIATFKNGKYPNKSGYHAAIYIEHTSNGIWVWDQWVGMPVHKRFIRFRNDNASASNTAQAYSLVE